jgi:hypothetical protein
MEKFSTQIKLIFVIFGDVLLPDEITNLLKVHPTNFWIKGDPIPLQKGLLRHDDKVPIRQESAWEFSLDFIKTLDVDIVLDQFERVFENKISILKDYILENKLETSLNIVVEIADEETPSIHFNKRIIKLCEALGAEIDIDIYLLNND